MIRKYPILFALFFSLLMLTSCYTVTYPETCPGVGEVDFNSELELETALLY